MNGLRRSKAQQGAARLADGDTAERKGRQRLDSDSLKVMQSERIIKHKDQREAQARGRCRVRGTIRKQGPRSRALEKSPP